MGHNTARIIGTKARVISRSKLEDAGETTSYQTAKRRAVRYWFVKCSFKRGDSVVYYYRTEIVSPFHSRLYGACGFGGSKARAKARLRNNLANNYGFIGTMLLAGADEADNVGISAAEVWRRANNTERKVLKNANGR